MGRLSSSDGMSDQELTQTLIDSFGALADEVQNLVDRKTILEHKLRYAHERYQYLADKYAPSSPEISETLAGLQLPPETQQSALSQTNFVPLPTRRQSGTSQHQLALVIREGRKAARNLSAAATAANISRSGSSKQTTSATTMTSLSTVLEQDFTVQGKKSNLDCPFSAKKNHIADLDTDQRDSQNLAADMMPHHSGDPICAAMATEDASGAGATAAVQCPIRFLDQHSPEEIADYVEKHKHQLPRSHEVCVRRYQRSEDQIKKLDAKYGNLVSMINDLSQLHKPMLPSASGEETRDIEGASTRRVENWAHEVSAASAKGEEVDHAGLGEEPHDVDDQDRQSRYDRPMQEIRVGESPSRPWGYQVPVQDGPDHDDDHPPASPPPAPVRMPSVAVGEVPQAPTSTPRKCPFDHSRLSAMMDSSPRPKTEEKSLADSVRREETEVEEVEEDEEEEPRAPSPAKQTESYSGPAFIDSSDAPRIAPSNNTAAMVFTGPVFVGYPLDQAIEIMKHYHRG